MKNKKKREVHFGKKALSNVRRYFPQVINVVDADNPLQIELTRNDSEFAKTRDHKACALAVACTRSMHSDGAIVAVKTAYLIFKDRAVRYRLPESVAREIVSFDRNAGFTPGVYQLNAPSKFEKLGSLYSGATRNPSGRRSPQFRHITANVRTVLGHSGVTQEPVTPERPAPAPRVPAYIRKRAAKQKRARGRK